MQLGIVLGHTTATVKHASLEGNRLAVVQPLMADGRSPDGDPVVAVDRLGSARHDVVLLTSDGDFVREILRSNTTPVRWTVMGIRD